MSERIMTVKGIGRVIAKPDWVVITMEFITITPDYAKTMKRADDEISAGNQRGCPYSPWVGTGNKGHVRIHRGVHRANKRVIHAGRGAVTIF